jgi:ABC-type lipoprotein export system ATPase subunit
MIKIKNLHKSYNIGKNSLHVLKGLDLEIKEGELVAIMGSSGSGKSTLLNIIGMLDNHDKGSYELDGVIIKKMNETKAAEYRKVLLADEPTGALDSNTSKEVMDLIQKINKAGKTILVVTHEHDISQMCSRIVKLKDGVIVEDKKIKQKKAL